MIKTVYILAITLFAFACGRTNPTADHGPGSKRSKKAGSDKAQQTNRPLTNLDSINKANNESVIASEEQITKAFVFLSDGDSTIHLTSNIKKDHRIFGYARPDTRSERILLLSVFTSDVENNPFGCKLGSYYDTSGMGELKLNYISSDGGFVKARASDKNDSTTIYFERKWIDQE